MLNDTSSVMRLLETRRSCKPRDMIEPGPTADELNRIIAAGMRVPDHGKLAPWLFHIVDRDQRDGFARLMRDGAFKRPEDMTAFDNSAIDQFAQQAPTLVVVSSLTTRHEKIPIWEQQLSSGAACMQMLNAATALGYVGCWLTGWAAYSHKVIKAFVPETGMIAGFMFFGSPSKEMRERPRPEPAQVTRHWRYEDVIENQMQKRG
jgi:nitroreductase